MSKLAVSFYGIFLLIFLAEGLGLLYGHIISFYLIIFSPALFLIINPKLIKQITFPKKLSILFCLFIIFSMISVIGGVQLFPSFMFIFFYLSLFLIFIIFNSQKVQLEKYLINFVYLISAIFTIISLSLNWLIKEGIAPYIPFNGYQYVTSRFGSHNHLGDLLAVTVVLSFYNWIKLKQNRFLLPIIIFLPVLLLSYSRSAYFALILGVIYLLIKFIKGKTIKIFTFKLTFALIVIFILFSFIFITVKESKIIPLFNACNQFLQEKLNLKDKYFISKRLEFFNQARLSFIEKPLFGLGPDKFYFASIKHNRTGSWTISSHNIFLDVLAENGALAFIPLFLMLGIITLKALKTDSAFSIGFLVMLVNFQTDYTFKIYSFLLLFTIFASLSFSEKENIHHRI